MFKKSVYKNSTYYNPKKNTSFFQPKLTINPPNDIYEQEADVMADKVMRMPSNKNENTFFKPANISSIQRKCEHCEEEEKLQMKSEGSANAAIEAPTIVHDVINSGGQPLDEGTRKFFEPRFGYHFGNVRIHTDTSAVQSAQSINALAYTTGNNIVFNQNQFSPETDSGKKLLAHELTHVIQQKNITGIQRAPATPPSPAVSDSMKEIERLLALKFSNSKDPRLAERRKQLLPLFDSLNLSEGRALLKRLTNPKRGDVLAKNFKKLARESRAELLIFLADKVDFLKLVVHTIKAYDGADFCKPFTPEEVEDDLPLLVADEMEGFIMEYIRDFYGDEVAYLWSLYLERRKGDDMTPEIFSDPANEITDAFVHDPNTLKRQQQIIEIIEKSISRSCPALQDNVWTDIDIATLVSKDELNAKFSFPLSPIPNIPGLIAGGVSPDPSRPDEESRKISGKIQLYKKTDGGKVTVWMKTKFHFLIKDVIDFCPGNRGPLLARTVTVPLSRLEASNLAYDVPFEVHYDGPVIDKLLDAGISKSCDTKSMDEEAARREQIIREAKDKARDESGTKTPSEDKAMDETGTKTPSGKYR